MNKAMLCNIIGWSFKNAGLLDEDGFTIPLTVEEDILGEVTIFDENDLTALKKE